MLLQSLELERDDFSLAFCITRRYLCSPSYRVQPVKWASVGWVERSETHHLRGFMMGFASSTHPTSFNFFRGDDWMQEPCRSCDEKEKDKGGCRCQAYLLADDMYATDPVCSKSPNHHVIEEAIASARNSALTENEKPLIFRNSKNSRLLS